MRKNAHKNAKLQKNEKIAKTKLFCLLRSKALIYFHVVLQFGGGAGHARYSCHAVVIVNCCHNCLFVKCS